MAAIVAGLIPILRAAVDATTSYECRSVWFGFLCIRLVILFLAQLPFTKLDADFTCNATRDDVCSKAHFNELFDLYVFLSWNLPALRSGPYECHTDICSQFHVCVVRAAPEKRMAIYALSSISGMIIVFSVLFCIYSVAHCLCVC